MTVRKILPLDCCFSQVSGKDSILSTLNIERSALFSNILANEVNIALLASLQRNPISKLEHLLRMMVWNQHQYKTKGDARPLSKETAEIIAKQIFANEDEQMNELL